MINWNDVWKHQMLILGRTAALQSEFWDGVARRGSGSGLTDLTGKQLGKMRISHADALLEVGPGDGRLTVPLAKIAKAVTVVEPSKGMLEALKENARMSGVHNIRYVNKRWEDVEVGGEVEEHDVVVASFSLLVFDLKAALEKIDSAARKAAYIFFSAESWIPEDLQGLLFGEAFGMLSDHIIAYNLLHSIGITPNVEVIEYEMRKCFNTFDEALRDFAESYAVPSSKARVLEGYLKNALVEESDGLWYKRRRKAALIWWTK